MEDRGNKTIICSVFFLDIVEYSKKSVSGQISLKERFNSFLSTAIEGVPINDRIILDTGDGAAISFLGDVEDALRAALSMRSSLIGEDGLVDPPLLVRMGVNLGPVRLVKDINGQPNIVGDGINVAQRVMGFAEPGQILVSRSYYDAASRLSQEYAGMFHYVGSRTDKHVREHEVYAIGYPGDLTGSYKSPGAGSANKLSDIAAALASKSRLYWDASVTRANDLVLYVSQTFNQSSSKQKAAYIGGASVSILLLLFLLISVATKSTDNKGDSLKVASVADGMMNATTSGVVAASAPVVTAKTEKPEARSAAHPANVKADKKVEKHEKDKKDKAAKADKKPHKEAAPASGASAIVLLNVRPWGEVYLDGKMAGVSPPLTKLTVASGEHVIEIKNANFPVFSKVVKLKAGDESSIRHAFAN